MITSDPRRLEGIVANLVGNALEHGGDGVAVRVGRDGNGAVRRSRRRRPGDRARAPAAPVRTLLQGRSRPVERRHRARPGDRAGERPPAGRADRGLERARPGRPLHASTVTEPLQAGDRSVSPREHDGCPPTRWRPLVKIAPHTRKLRRPRRFARRRALPAGSRSSGARTLSKGTAACRRRFPRRRVDGLWAPHYELLAWNPVRRSVVSMAPRRQRGCYGRIDRRGNLRGLDRRSPARVGALLGRQLTTGVARDGDDP